MPVTSGSSAPYAPASAVIDLINRYRSKGLPTPITGETLGRAGISDSLIPRTLQALKTLDLIDEGGEPTGTFESLRLSTEVEYQDHFVEWLNGAYADVLKFVDPESADVTEVRDAFRTYTPIAQQPRMVTLFMGLYASAGIGQGKATASRRGRGASISNGSVKAKVSARSALADRADAPSVGQKSGSGGAGHSDASGHPTKAHVHGKPLEYHLIDLLKDPDIGDNERDAIWTLVQFLSGKKDNG